MKDSAMQGLNDMVSFARVVEAKSFSEAARVVSHRHSAPRGVLKVTASVAFGTLHVAPAQLTSRE